MSSLADNNVSSNTKNNEIEINGDSNFKIINGYDNNDAKVDDSVYIPIEQNDNDIKDDDVKESNPKPEIKRFSLEWFGFGNAEVDSNKAPVLGYFEIFKIFLSFGCRAFGGPVAQISMMKEEMVIERKWISVERFNRVYAVYQILPGPEATELACYFGMLSRGRIGAFLGGLGFVTPGVLLMLLWSYIYVEYGEHGRVLASFRCIQITVSAFIFKANFKLAEHALLDGKSKVFSWSKGLLCIFCFLTATSGLNFFISLAVSGIMNTVFTSSLPYKNFIAIFIGACTLGFYVLYVIEQGVPSGSLVGANVSKDGGHSLRGLFELGLIAGMVSFGGAYTTLPFIYADAVTLGGWLTSQQFLDALAITNILPTPLVTFVALVGYIGGGIGGACLMIIGIFMPAFSFTIIGHQFFEAMVDNKLALPFLDGISSAVIGLLTVTAFQFMKESVTTGVDAVVFFLSFYSIFYFTDKFTQPIAIAVAAIAGQLLY